MWISRSDSENNISRKTPTEDVNIDLLLDAWDNSSCFIGNDWAIWIRDLTIMLLKHSPSKSLQCCSSLAINFAPIGDNLFNYAFISLWSDITEKNLEEVKDNIIARIEQALMSDSIPLDILHKLLDMVEFMELREIEIMFDIVLLGKLAEKCAAYAKSLHYREIEYAIITKTQNSLLKTKSKIYKFPENPRSLASVLEDIVTLSHMVYNYDEAHGLIKILAKKVEIPLEWYTKLQRWYEADYLYEIEIEDNSNNVELMVNRMEVLNNLGEWNEVYKLADHAFSIAKDNYESRKIASQSLFASLHLGLYDDIKDKVLLLEPNSRDGSFYRIISGVVGNNFESAEIYLKKSRQHCITDLRSIIGESYTRAYKIMVQIQQLAELEEIIEGLKNPDSVPKILSVWNTRLHGIEKSVDTWLQIFAVRSLLVPPHKYTDAWVELSKMSSASFRPGLAMRLLRNILVGFDNDLVPGDYIPDKYPRVKYEYLKHLWRYNRFGDNTEHALTAMESWVNTFDSNYDIPNERKSKCYNLLAAWQLSKYRFDERNVENLLYNSKKAVDLDPENQSSWRVWAMSNYRILLHISKNGGTQDDYKHYAIIAIDALINCISIENEHNLIDMLRLLTLWFNYGEIPDVFDTLQSGLESIPINSWLLVIPQMISRVELPSPVSDLVKNILFNLGDVHPQSLVFPLIVASKSGENQRVNEILDHISRKHEKLVNEGRIVGNELIRIAILWNEKWFKALNEAYSIFHSDELPKKKFENMKKVLLPLHLLLKQGYETSHEKKFMKSFEKDLNKAWECCLDYEIHGKDSYLKLAWDLYGHVYRTIQIQLENDFTTLNLKHISPKLLNAEITELSIPGTYINMILQSKEKHIITKFFPTLEVIQSKQKPRKIVINSQISQEFSFLLKGNEDLKLDERVMQLFGLVNQLLGSLKLHSGKKVRIKNYQIIPLSHESGLIEWIPHCHTLHEIISHYRAKHNIDIEIELSYMERFCNVTEYYKLPVTNKLEIFEYALDKTNGDDLERYFWLNSSNSETWFEKRLTFINSLACVSMVGYILGLGDRHPNNIMINKNTGMIINIDFGDCFEVAMNREQKPEKVPFRLTRTLVNAMEVSGIEGNFRSTCEKVMQILRENSESILSVLETFVYDPIINWRFNLEPMDVYENMNERDEAIHIGSLSKLRLPNIGNDFETSFHLKGLNSENLHNLMNPKAVSVLDRITQKLTGNDFERKSNLDVINQVGLLINQATSKVNLCQSYLGWCPYW
eukprot:TRINITY_DN3490_c2_g1_i1.p1 TRINITY_DN3490_c2_g1~~TRINITY_DN3490_c2_g1_i1.p1  ORF type:complete len:1462 (-),score=255.39 TRINITY_DN3490_c2_g1_i1:71-3847(-)